MSFFKRKSEKNHLYLLFIPSKKVFLFSEDTNRISEKIFFISEEIIKNSAEIKENKREKIIKKVQPFLLKEERVVSSYHLFSNKAQKKI